MKIAAASTNPRESFEILSFLCDILPRKIGGPRMTCQSENGVA
jgi:hypothetical protein